MKVIIRGCHSTVTPVVLPETLPDHVSQALVTRFRAHLSSQLRHLSLGGSTGQKNSHYRNTSETSYSVTSSNEGATEIVNPAKKWLEMHKPPATR